MVTAPIIENCVMVNPLPSASESTPSVRVLPDIAIFSFVETASSIATGTSFTGVIVKLRVPISVP